jgi:hypothetical protein
MLRRMTALALLACALSGVLAACSSPVSLRTAQTRFDACEQALLAGELVKSSRSGLAVRDSEGVTEVLWPAGYSATKETTGLVLRDETGRVLVHEGQRVQMSGGLGADNTWTACAGTIQEVSNVGG